MDQGAQSYLIHSAPYFTHLHGRMKVVIFRGRHVLKMMGRSTSFDCILRTPSMIGEKSRKKRDELARSDKALAETIEDEHINTKFHERWSDTLEGPQNWRRARAASSQPRTHRHSSHTREEKGNKTETESAVTIVRSKIMTLNGGRGGPEYQIPYQDENQG
jgi:hypothetical protein